jgi:pentapeptide repeat protein
MDGSSLILPLLPHDNKLDGPADFSGSLRSFHSCKRFCAEGGGLSMPDPIDELKDAAVRKANETGKLEDIERAVSVCKLAAEAQKGSAEAATQKSVVRQEGLKNWAQLLVPLLSVVTLAVTMLTQTSQQREQARSREDGIWRSTIEEFKSATQRNVPLGGLMAQVKLKPFFKSPVYGDQANQLARLVLPRIGDPDAFKDLFESVEWRSLNEMVIVNRSLSNLYDEVATGLQKLPSPDAAQQPPPAPTPSNGRGAPPQPRPLGQQASSPFSPSIRDELEHSETTIKEEERYVCDRIADAARSGKLTWDKSPNLDRSWFINCDLSGMDFRNAVLTDATFDGVNLDSARLGNITKLDNLSVYNVAWWRAAEISPVLLKALIDCCDAGADSEKYVAEKPSKEAYVKRVTELCKSNNLVCPEATIKFTVATPATK